MSIFMIDKDLGNVAYSSWIKSVLDQGTRNPWETYWGSLR